MPICYEKIMKYILEVTILYSGNKIVIYIRQREQNGNGENQNELLKSMLLLMHKLSNSFLFKKKINVPKS